MIGSLSLFSPGSISSYGSSVPAATPQGMANDGSAVCTSLDCAEHGAANRARLQQAQLAGLAVAGEKQNAAPARPVASGRGGLSSGATLLGAQQGSGGSNGAAKGADDLTEEERAQVDKLKKTDAKVRAHERAHAATGGQYAGAPSYSYTRGPDGQMYATGGEVPIDVGPESDPHATLQKANQVAAAALAPADPSGQDRAVAAAAAKLRLEAQAEIRKQEQAERDAKESGEGSPVPSGAAAGSAPQPVAGPAGLSPGQQAAIQTLPDASSNRRDGPAVRASHAYGQGNDSTFGRADAFARLGQLVGLIA